MNERFLVGFNLLHEESLAKISRECGLTDLQHHEQHCKDEHLESVHRAGALGALTRPGDTDSMRKSLHRFASISPVRLENSFRRHIDEDNYVAPEKSLAEASFREEDQD